MVRTKQRRGLTHKSGINLIADEAEVLSFEKKSIKLSVALSMG